MSMMMFLQQLAGAWLRPLHHLRPPAAYQRAPPGKARDCRRINNRTHNEKTSPLSQATAIIQHDLQQAIHYNLQHHLISV